MASDFRASLRRPHRWMEATESAQQAIRKSPSFSSPLTMRTGSGRRLRARRDASAREGGGVPSGAGGGPATVWSPS
jgi:hypothetical protein